MNDLALELYEEIRRKLQLSEDIRPCMALLIDNRQKLPGDVPFILACELHRIGNEPKGIRKILDSLYIKEGKITGILKSIKTKGYKFDCSTLKDRGFCLEKEKEDCLWWKKSPNKNKRGWEENDFYRYGWDKRLRLTEECLYRAIRAIEIRRGWQPGTRLFVSLDQLHKQSRISRGSITKKLRILKKFGLIKYIPGDFRVKGSRARATQVTRIIPIPKPSNSQDTEQS